MKAAPTGAAFDLIATFLSWRSAIPRTQRADMNWGIRLSAVVATALVGSCLDISTPLQGVSRWLAKGRFEDLCAKRGGLEIDARSGLGGVISDNPNLGGNLWLLFDFGLPFVEFKRHAADDEALVREWGQAPGGPMIWRAERRPAGDPACATFEAWLARISREDFGYDALPMRWRERATYGRACLALTFRPLGTSEFSDDGARYFLRTDAGRIERIGCHDAYERRHALVDPWGRRIFIVNELYLRDFRCHVDGPGQQVASCSDPIAEDVSGERTWFVDDSQPEGRAALAAEQSR